jgi:hypothetical protein
MQHIGVQREDESGRSLAEFNDGAGIDLRIVKKTSISIVGEASSVGCCLRFIDPYGNFLVNQLQLPVLIVELAELSRAAEDAELRKHISDLVNFLLESKGPHIYVRFVGD